MENLYNLSFEKINELSKVDNLSEKQIIDLGNFLKVDKRKNVQLFGEKLIRSALKQKREAERIKAMYDFDKSFGEFNYVAGVDEVGRGPFAGPIVAAAVILDLNQIRNKNFIAGIKDSKLLSPEIREVLAEEIKQNAVAINIALISNKIIDDRGIGFCNQEVFRKACYGLKYKPELVLSDGYPIKNFNISNKAVVKGDVKSASIACASIVAKVFRDSIMKEYALKYPQYVFDHNSGYGTQEHINAIREYGITDIHRTSFLKNIL